MPRKPKDIVPIMLRIREHLRRRLESEAKKRAYSLNYEITRRLEDSFERGDLYTIGGIAHDMGTNWARGWGPALHKITVQNDLRNATETLIEQISAARWTAPMRQSVRRQRKPSSKYGSPSTPSIPKRQTRSAA